MTDTNPFVSATRERHARLPESMQRETRYGAANVRTLSSIMSKAVPSEHKDYFGYVDRAFDLADRAIARLNQINARAQATSLGLANLTSQARTTGVELARSASQIVETGKKGAHSIEAAAQGLSDEELAAREKAKEEERAANRKKKKGKGGQFITKLPETRQLSGQ